MNYSQLTLEDQYKILQSRIRNYEIKHFDTTINLQMAQMNKDSEGETKIKETLLSIEASIGFTNEMMARLPKPPSRAQNRQAKQLEFLEEKRKRFEASKKQEN